MQTIKRIVFNPGSEQADGYEVGKPEVNFEYAVIDSIEEIYHPATDEFMYVEIYTDGVVAARFRGVPYVAFMGR